MMKTKEKDAQLVQGTVIHRDIVVRQGEVLDTFRDSDIARTETDPYSKLLHCRVFIELDSGSKYMGKVLSVGPGYVELDCAIIKTKQIAVVRFL